MSGDAFEDAKGSIAKITAAHGAKIGTAPGYKVSNVKSLRPDVLFKGDEIATNDGPAKLPR